MQSVPTQFVTISATIHTTFLSIKLHDIHCYINNHYDVIISLADDVFTLGPFNESFISLLNIDKFCVNLKNNI